MKNLIGSALLLLSLNSTAMTKEVLGECLMNDGQTQALVDMVKEETRAKRITLAEYYVYINKMLAADVKTCRHASGLAAEQLAKTLIATPDAK